MPTEPHWQKVRVDTGTWTGIETVVAIGIEIEVAIGIESEPDTVDAIGIEIEVASGIESEPDTVDAIGLALERAIYRRMGVGSGTSTAMMASGISMRLVSTRVTHPRFLNDHTQLMAHIAELGRLSFTMPMESP